jgi:50S ribosomal protein L31 type B
LISFGLFLLLARQIEMKKFFYPALIILTACSPQNNTETEAKPAKAITPASAPTETQAEKNSGDTVKMTGTVHYSLEQAEFTSNGKTYFINGGDNLIDQVEKNRLSSGSYNVTLNNVCIQGKVLTKEQNQGNGFGPLGKYSQAVTVESLCQTVESPAS